MNVRAIGNFHDTRLGYLAFGVAELAACVMFANLAIPTGDWWEWLLTFVFLLGFIQNLGRMIVGVKK